MVHYVGLDVSLKQTSICVVSDTGSIVREGVVDSDPEAIAAFVRSKAPDTVRVGLESGPTATWRPTVNEPIAGLSLRFETKQITEGPHHHA
jgi:predicted NBD/HSP70 family sugar kinase